MAGKLKREIKQTKPFASLQEEVVLSMMRTADQLLVPMNDVLREANLSLSQYNVLRILRGAGDKGLPTLEIAERMIEQTPGITRLIDRLERKTLVRRERCETDRRQVFCRITNDGLKLLKDLDMPILAVDDWALAALPARELGQLITLLDKARKGLSAGVITRRSENQIKSSRRNG